MKSKKSIWSLLLLVVAMLAAVQFSCKKDEGDDESWECVLDITNEEDGYCSVYVDGKEIGNVAPQGCWNTTEEVTGESVRIYCVRPNGDIVYSKTVKKGESYKVVIENSNWSWTCKIRNSSSETIRLYRVYDNDTTFYAAIASGELMEKTYTEKAYSTVFWFIKAGEYTISDEALSENGVHEIDKEVVAPWEVSYSVTNNSNETIYLYGESERESEHYNSTYEIKPGKTVERQQSFLLTGSYTMYLKDSNDNIIEKRVLDNNDNEYNVVYEWMFHYYVKNNRSERVLLGFEDDNHGINQAITVKSGEEVSGNLAASGSVPVYVYSSSSKSNIIEETIQKGDSFETELD